MTPETANESLAQDLAQCHALIEELMATVRLQEREKAHLLHRVEYLVQQLYGRRSEKIDPAQLLLFAEEAMKAVTAQVPVEPEPEAVPAAPKKPGHGRKKLPVALPHLPLEHPVPDAEKFCAECQVDKRRIGEKITEQLEYAPSSLFVIDHTLSVHVPILEIRPVEFNFLTYVYLIYSAVVRAVGGPGISCP